jgi:hypothetical protein
MRGGKRKGAGRKPSEVSRVIVSMRVEPEIKERFEKMCEAKQLSQSERFSEWVKGSKL